MHDVTQLMWIDWNDCTYDVPVRFTSLVTGNWSKNLAYGMYAIQRAVRHPDLLALVG